MSESKIAILAETACGLMSVQALPAEESLSLIPSQLLDSTPATPQAAAVIAECDRTWQDDEMRYFPQPLCLNPHKLRQPRQLLRTRKWIEVKPLRSNFKAWVQSSDHRDER